MNSAEMKVATYMRFATAEQLDENSAAKRVIHEIPANPELLQKRQIALQQLRVAAYCRVSTDEEEQLASYAAQKAKYTEMINSNPNWKLVDIFADEGLSGTDTKKRDEFNRMIAACKKKKIDLIVVKSISRFARNTLDAIAHVRQLKALNVGVLFEKENISTLTMSNELVFTMLSAFAQAESESISENVRWGKRHAMKAGKVPFQYSRMLGYKKGDNGEPEIVPEQASIVKRIFGLFLAGRSLHQIKSELEADNVPTASGISKWSVETIRFMLKNERYIGDARLQKTYIVDCISKQVRQNRGEIPQYYIQNNHEGIIPKDVFYQVQEEMERRSSKRNVASKALSEKGKYSGKYALSELLVCGECGTHYRRVTWTIRGEKKIVWRCINRLEHGKRYCKKSPSLEETGVHDAILRATNCVLSTRDTVLDALNSASQAVLNSDDDGFDRLKAKQRVEKLEQMAAGILKMTDSDNSAPFFEQPLEEIYTERTDLLSKIAEADEREKQMGARSKKLKRLLQSIHNAPCEITNYSDDFTREVVESIEVIDAERLLVVFKGGIEIETQITGF